MQQTNKIVKPIFVVGVGLVSSLVAAPVHAQEENQVSRESARAQKRVSLGAQVELLPYGQISGGSDDASIDEDAAFAYGVAANLDFHLNRFLSIGLAPRLILNVTSKDQDPDQEDEDALKQVDARVRVKGTFPVGPMLDLYGYVAPGYSWILADDNTFGPVQVDDATGFVAAFAAGASFDLTPSFFLNGEVSYQLGFQQTTASVGPIEGDFDFKSDYLSVGLGAGARF
jgi:outer membrane protein with beta-barrel domain